VTSLREDLEHLLNSHNVENRCGTPDFILAAHMLAALDGFVATVNARDAWWGFEPKIGGIIPAVDPTGSAQ
jgi:hypothetical protein